jgi:hypothetical protein
MGLADGERARCQQVQRASCYVVSKRVRTIPLSIKAMIVLSDHRARMEREGYAVDEMALVFGKTGTKACVVGRDEAAAVEPNDW